MEAKAWDLPTLADEVTSDDSPSFLDPVTVELASRDYHGANNDSDTNAPLQSSATTINPRDLLRGSASPRGWKDLHDVLCDSGNSKLLALNVTPANGDLQWASNL